MLLILPQLMFSVHLGYLVVSFPASGVINAKGDDVICTPVQTLKPSLNALCLELCLSSPFQVSDQNPSFKIDFWLLRTLLHNTTWAGMGPNCGCVVRQCHYFSLGYYYVILATHYSTVRKQFPPCGSQRNPHLCFTLSRYSKRARKVMESPTNFLVCGDFRQWI